MTKAAIQELDWEILLHLPYPPDLAPSDYPLFLGVSFNNDAELQNWLHAIFTTNPADFFKRGMENLPER
jgi:hypothetical protein